MAVRYGITIDCADPGLLGRFWAEALGYRPKPPPDGYATWFEHWRAIGVPEEELGDGDGAYEVLEDPDGKAPRIWFQPVPEAKTVKNRLHLDITASGGRDFTLDVRRERVRAEVERLVALGATVLRELSEPGIDHYGIVLADPEGNEFCVN
jgi:hypothetical protein